MMHQTASGATAAHHIREYSEREAADLVGIAPERLRTLIGSISESDSRVPFTYTKSLIGLARILEMEA